VHQAEPEHPDYQLEEVFIVLISDAIIEVPAMVVEPRRAPIALPAMLGSCKHMRIANLAMVFIVRPIESYVVDFAILF